MTDRSEQHKIDDLVRANLRTHLEEKVPQEWDSTELGEIGPKHPRRAAHVDSMVAHIAQTLEDDCEFWEWWNQCGGPINVNGLEDVLHQIGGLHNQAWGEQSEEILKEEAWYAENEGGTKSLTDCCDAEINHDEKRGWYCSDCGRTVDSEGGAS